MQNSPRTKEGWSYVGKKNKIVDRNHFQGMSDEDLLDKDVEKGHGKYV
jgi:hypothetical protein